MREGGAGGREAGEPRARQKRKKEIKRKASWPSGNWEARRQTAISHMPSPITKGSESDKEAPSPNDSREKMTMDPSDTIEQPTDEHPVQEEQDEPTNDSMEVELPEAVEKKDEVDTDEDEVSDIDVDTEEQETAVAKEVVVESPQPKNDEESGDKGTIIDVEKDEDSVAAVKVAADVKSFDDADTSMKNDVVSWKEQKKLGETFDAALARLQEVRILRAVILSRNYTNHRLG